ncbi:hypothetical protein GCM10022206_20600 [Streptomyces chiangmaiensis]
MGLRPLPRRTGMRGAFVCAALLPPSPAHAAGASTARLPGLALADRAAALTARVQGGIRTIRSTIASRLRALKGSPRGPGPACSHAGRRHGPPAQDTASSRLRAVLTAARELLRGLAASRCPRVPAGPAKSLSWTPDGPAPYEPLPARQGPDDDAP